MDEIRSQLATMGIPSEGETFAGKYRMERVLGVGGMGVVIAAHHLQLDQPVAIKVLLPEVAKNGAMVARFIREGRAAAKIKSEHVARVYDVAELASGGVYLVMEYLDGIDLARLSAQQAQMPVRDVADYVMQACDALAEAHAQGIVHRDLKPANLFLADSDGEPCIKVLDFGISKLALADGDTSVRLTKTQDLAGSPLYMSPEQLRSLRDVDARTDVWSLGVVLYELLVGAPPFEGTTPHVVSAAILKDPTPSILEHRADLPKGLAAIIESCLEKDPGARMPSVGALAEALAPYAGPIGEACLERIRRISTTPASLRGTRVVAQSSPNVKGTDPTVASGTGATISATTSAPVARERSNAKWIVAALGALAIGGGVAFAMRGKSSEAPSAPAASATASSATPIATPVPTPIATPATVAPVVPSVSASVSAKKHVTIKSPTTKASTSSTIAIDRHE